MKEREYKVLEAISEDEYVTQAELASQLGIAVGSVNWYIKRMVNIGYIKATRMDRTRLKYNLTPEGMTALAKRAGKYFSDALVVYKRLRDQSRKIVDHLNQAGITRVWLRGKSESIDILRLTCIEAGIHIEESPSHWCIRIKENYQFELYKHHAEQITEGTGVEQ
ncbi:MAG: winged helix-turn-helix transcriptional regulator [Anaerolineales bacterium]|nr:winged helix-turn-helix transcriptional regulator [Anaerolineales bacterium]